MLFQGQEFGSSKPFVYFSDVGDEKLKGRHSQGAFRIPGAISFDRDTEETQKRLADRPSTRRVYARCKLDFTERAEES